tara:strand:- start:1892 stop:2077 length:186 start_codon:yes stop_codon:yes gene_type:complete
MFRFLKGTHLGFFMNFFTTHLYKGNAKQLALSFSLFLSLFLYSSSSLIEEENDDDDEFFYY